MPCPLSCLMHPDNVPTSTGHAPGLAAPEESSPLTAQAARGCQDSACPAPTGNSWTLQSADLPFLFPEEQSPCSGELRLAPPVSVRELGQLSQDSAALLSGIFRRLCWSQLSTPGVRECRQGPMYLFSFTFTASSPAPLVAIVSPVQLTGACVFLMKTPPHSPDLTREASPP